MAIADITQADVVATAPELTGSTVVSDALWVMLLAYVNQFNLTECDTDADRFIARVYLAAHIASSTTLANDGEVGPLTGESAGGIRRSYGLLSLASSPTYIGTTRYGQTYLDILAMSGCAGPFLV